MADVTHPKILVLVRFKSALQPDEVVRRYRERLPQFGALPGLVQKYYIQDPSTDEWGGLYMWDSQESFDEYLESDLRKSIAEAYQVVGTPRIDKLAVVDVLRPEKT